MRCKSGKKLSDPGLAKRLELLRDVRREPAPPVKALADRLGRDYKRVHEDVETLAASGFLQR